MVCTNYAVNWGVHVCAFSVLTIESPNLQLRNYFVSQTIVLKFVISTHKASPRPATLFRYTNLCDAVATPLLKSYGNPHRLKLNAPLCVVIRSFCLLPPACAKCIPPVHCQRLCTPTPDWAVLRALLHSVCIQ